MIFPAIKYTHPIQIKYLHSLISSEHVSNLNSSVRNNHAVPYNNNIHIYINVLASKGNTAVILDYRHFSNLRCTQSQNINVSHIVWQLSLPNPLKPGVKLRVKM